MSLRDRSGQSLIDVLIASGVGAILLVGALAVLSPALRGSTDAQYAQTGSTLARGMLDRLRSHASGNWSSLAALGQGSSNHFYFSTSSTSTVAIAGIENIDDSAGTFSRSFFLEPVRRNSSGAIVPSGGFVDPSTLMATIEYQWPRGVARSIVTYLTRSRSKGFVQDDWTGGPGLTTPATDPDNRFDLSSGISFDGSFGSIVLDLP